MSSDILVTKYICNKWILGYLKKLINSFTPGLEPYPDAVVSFWRVDKQNVPKELLCVGALIKPNWIVIPKGIFEPSETFDDIFLFTGRKMKNDKIRYKDKSNLINFKIVGRKFIEPDFKLLIFVVSTSA